jgi:hypothetical protein
MTKTCIDEEAIADYIEARLSANERAVLEQHLSVCDQCLDDVDLTRTILKRQDRLDLDTVPDNVTQGAVEIITKQSEILATSPRDKIKRFLGDMHTTIAAFFRHESWTHWRLAPVRGSKQMVSKDLVRVKKVFKNLAAEIEIENIEGNRANIRVKLYNRKSNRVNARVSLVKKDREILSYLLEDQDSALFEGVPFGKYHLVFTRDGVKLGVYHFAIKEPENE